MNLDLCFEELWACGWCGFQAKFWTCTDTKYDGPAMGLS